MVHRRLLLACVFAFGTCGVLAGCAEQAAAPSPQDDAMTDPSVGGVDASTGIDPNNPDAAAGNVSGAAPAQ